MKNKGRKLLVTVLAVMLVFTGGLFTQGGIKADAATVKSISTLAQLKTAMTSKTDGSYKLTKDITGLKKELDVMGGTKTLDLNGHSIKGDNYYGSLIFVYGGTLTVKDTKGGGYIKNAKDQDAVGIGKGKLNIRSGKYIGIEYGVYQEGGTLNISGGTIQGTTNAIKVYRGTCNITGGTFKATDGTSYGVYIFGENNTHNVKLSGGTVNAASAIEFQASTKSKLVVSGGTYRGTVTGLSVDGAGNANVKGGTFKGNNGTGISISPLSKKVTFNMSAGKCYTYSNNAYPISITNNADVIINGGRFYNEGKGTGLLFINKNFCGTKDIADGIFGDSVVFDNTPEGQNVEKTSGKRTGLEYESGMEVSSIDDMYSMLMSAFEGLHTAVNFQCPKSLYDDMDYYLKDWVHNIAKSVNISASIKNGVATVKFDVSYQQAYQALRISADPSVAERAGSSAVSYMDQIDEILKSIVKDSMTDKEKAKAVHDYFVKNYSYDYSFADVSYEYYGPLKTKKAVCQGFATLYQIMMTKCGIPCETVSGVAAGSSGGTDYERHMWNRIKVSGTWYYVDVTYDEGLTKSNTDIKHTFFYRTKDSFYGLGYHVEG